MRGFRTFLCLFAAANAFAPAARADGPDRSNPEAAYRSFLEVDQAFQQEVVAFKLVGMARFQETAMVRLASPETGRRYGIRTANGRNDLAQHAANWSVEFDGTEEESKDLVVVSLRRVRVAGLGAGGRVSKVERRERVTYIRELGLWRIQKRERACPECEGVGHRPGEERCPNCGGRSYFEEEFGRFPLQPIPSDEQPPRDPPAADLSTPQKAAESYLAAVGWAYVHSMAGFAALFEKSLQVYAPFYAADRMARAERSWAEARTKGRALLAGLTSGVESIETRGEMVASALVWCRRPGEGGQPVEERLRLAFVRQESGEWKFKSEDPACDRCHGSGKCPRHPAGDPATAECLFCGGDGVCRTCQGEGYLKGSVAGDAR